MLQLVQQQELLVLMTILVRQQLRLLALMLRLVRLQDLLALVTILMQQQQRRLITLMLRLVQRQDLLALVQYVPELSHCIVTDLTDAQQRQIQLDSTVQLNSTEQTEPTALAAQHTEPRHLYEPSMNH